MKEKENEVKEAIIEALSNKIREEAKKKLCIPTLELGEPVGKVIEYFVRELAEKTYKLGIALKKQPEDW